MAMKLLALFFGFFISICTSLPACTKKNASTTIQAGGPQSTTNNKTWLALGDSYTIGQGVQTIERFPHITSAMLRQQNISLADPLYIAMTGWTTLNLQNAINQTTLGTYDVVSLLIGVNDQYQGLDTAGYRLRFTQLINKAVSLAGNNAKKVFVLSIPDYSVTPFVSAASKSRISREIDEFNAINKQIALGYNIAYIDITPLTREVANDPSLLANDGLHYSGKQHQKWAELLAPLVKAVLQ
jgi:lysophospholipase L1-like esterase